MHRAAIVVDLGFGDAGKGSVVDAIAKHEGASLVVRYNGGAQAAHTVVAPDGRTFTFSQWGSASFLPGTDTFLSRFMIVDPLALAIEEDRLAGVGIADGYERLYVDENALVATPLLRALNRLRERARAKERHGSCGMGIGETVSFATAYPRDAIRFGDLLDEAKLRSKLARQLDYARASAGRISEPREERALLFDRSGEAIEYFVRESRTVASHVRVASRTYLSERLRGEGMTVFEGAQGVLLDERHGFAPYVTWSDTTTRNARTLLEESGSGALVRTVGVLRAYATRHGPGPFPSEDPSLDLPDSHNSFGEWQREFRVGWLDLPLLRYALRAAGHVDALAVNALDRLAERDEIRVATEHHDPGGASLTLVPDRSISEEESLIRTKRLATALPRYETLAPSELVARIVRELSLPVLLEGWGAKRTEKRWNGALFPN